MNRRDFMKNTMAAGAGVGLLGHAAQGAPSAQPGTKVPRRTLGNTGESVPVIMMGTNQALDPKYDKRLHRAYQLGVDYIDTAEMYAGGQSHSQIAPFIKQVGDRKKLWITSKAHISLSDDGPKEFEQALDKALADLGTDYLDLFFMHMAHEENFLDKRFLDMGEALKKSGKIRYFGFSAHDGSVPRMLEKAAALGGGIDAVLFRYNFRMYGDVAFNKALDAAHKAGIGLIAMKTLAAIPKDAEEIVPFTSKDFTLTQAKLKAVLADERIAGIASQMSNVEQVMENTGAVLSDQELAMNDFMQLHRLAGLTACEYCIGCGLCEGKVDGPLRIADTMRYLMYHDCYGKQDEARALYRKLAAAERDFGRADLHAAKAACPQGIDIPAKLAQAQRVLSA